MIYLDHAATTPVDPEVLEAMLPFFTRRYANPASAHRPGRDAAEAVDRARREVAGLLGSEPDEIVFTGGGTESNNQALAGTAAERGRHIVTSSIEHPSVLEACRHLQGMGREVTFVPVDPCGLVDPEDVRRAVTGRTAVISIMHASNEVGILQPLGEISEIARERGVLLHTDAVQT
ncbi:MAG: cysteine desulfurase family protein, partial [Spirochaetota bacterium]